MATVLPNPAWPLMDVQVDNTAGPPGVPGISRMSLQRRGLGVGQLSLSWGRQYEQGRCEAGTATVTVQDPKELLNPSNTTSPFNSGGNTILPYRRMWIPVIWPTGPGSGNIINTSVNTTYDPSFELNPSGLLGGWTAAGGSTTLAQSAAQHFVGTKALLVTQSAAGSGFGVVNRWRTVPGITYTMSAYVYPTGGCSVTMQVTDAAGTVWTSNTASVQNTWTRVLLTWTAVDTVEANIIYGTGTATPTFYVDGTQLEFGAAASAFGTTGPTLYPLMTGYVERWPETWTEQGFRALHALVCVDALSPLSRVAISQSYAATIAADLPLISIPFDNTTSMTISTAGPGMGSAVPLEVPSTNGNLQWGSDTNPDGTPALAINQRNATNPPSTSVPQQSTSFEIVNRPVSLSTAGATVEVWTRFSSGVVSFLGLAEDYDPVGIAYTGSYLVVESPFTTLTEALAFVIYDPPTSTAITTNVSAVNPAVTGFPDGQWHYYAITFNTGGTRMILTVDNVEVTYTVALGNRTIGYQLTAQNAFTGYGSPQAQVSISRIAAYTRDVGTTTRLSHYQRGAGYINELSGARVSRLLTQYWTPSGINVASGQAQMAPDHSYNTRNLLDVLNEIADTENGLLYVNRSGNVVFEDRTSRYISQTSIATFGDGTGELPYENLEYDFDPTYVYSQTNLSRPGNVTYPVQTNSASQTAYGQRILSQQLQVNTDFDLTQASIFYLQRYGSPVPRIRTMTLNPAGNSAMWPTVLSLEISQRVTVKRRINGVVMSADYYVEQVSHTIDVGASPPTWDVKLQLSPVFVSKAWVLGDATYGILGTTTTPVY